MGPMGVVFEVSTRLGGCEEADVELGIKFPPLEYGGAAVAVGGAVVFLWLYTPGKNHIKLTILKYIKAEIWQ